MIAKPAIAGLSTYGIIYIGESSEAAFGSLFLLGAGSVFAGDYLSKIVSY